MPDLPVLVFPGQGAQAVGMGRDLAEAVPQVAALFKRADEVLGFDLTRTIFEGPEEALRDTAVQQPALVLVSLAAAKALEVRRGKPLDAAAAAGLSLGEYAALAAVGALAFDDALKLVRRRGQLMKEASDKVPSGMAVVLKLEADKIAAACAQAAQETGGVVSPCNYNGGGQIVIGGAHEALDRAMALCKDAGAKRCMKLPVHGAFHTEIMRPAAEGLKEALAKTPIQAARAPVYANVSAKPVREPADIRAALEAQLTSPVLWEQTVLNLSAAGHTRYLELGAGKTVSNMISKIDGNAQTSAVGSVADLDAVGA